MVPNSGNESPQETEVLDVVVTLDVTSAAEVGGVLSNLRETGLKVVRVDELNGVVEGTIAA